jgi:hypothetical protein
MDQTQAKHVTTFLLLNFHLPSQAMMTNDWNLTTSQRQQVVTNACATTMPKATQSGRMTEQHF